MRWQEISEEGLPLGPLSKCPIRNTGVLGRLEDALCVWVCGSMSLAQEHLLALKDEAAKFRDCDARMLFRGMVMAHPQGDVIITTNPATPLASWSVSPDEVEKFMEGWERPWVMMAVPKSEINIYIDLVDFCHTARPATQMRSQGEVIAIMPPQMMIPRSNCVFFDARGVPLPQDQAKLERWSL